MSDITIRYWQHEGQWRIQSYEGKTQDRYGVLQDTWRSLAVNGQVLMFETEQQAREYHEKMEERQDVQQI